MQPKTLLAGFFGLSLTALASDVQLFIHELESGESNTRQLVNYKINPEEGTFDLVASLDDDSYPSGPVCISANINGETTQEFPCFSYMKLDKSSEYVFIMDLQDDNKIHDISFAKIGERVAVKPESKTEEEEEQNLISSNIIPNIRFPSQGPQASAISLKKVTKTYQDKRAELEKQKGGQLGALDAVSSEDEETDEEEKTWFEKNWKSLAIGFMIYNLFSSFTRNNRRQEEKD